MGIFSRKPNMQSHLGCFASRTGENSGLIGELTHLKAALQALTSSNGQFSQRFGVRTSIRITAIPEFIVGQCS